MKKVTLKRTAILIAVLVGVYFYFSDKDYIVRISEFELQSKMAEKLPIIKTYYFIIQITLENPRVALENGSNRINVGLDVKFDITVSKAFKPLLGSIDISGGVKYIRDEGAFYLLDPVIEKLNVQGIPNKFTGKITSAVTKSLAAYYAKHPIYTLKSQHRQQAMAKRMLKNVIVKDQKLVITFGV